MRFPAPIVALGFWGRDWTTPGLALPDPATVAVVGGGPSGAFLAIALLKRARQLGRTVELLLLEKKPELQFVSGEDTVAYREGCNHCAGGISPRLVDVLQAEGIAIPEELIAGEVRSLAVHGDWKSIELSVPDERRMLCVFRGARPKGRPDRHVTFDSYLLARAVEQGARVVTGEAHEIRYSSTGMPLILYTADQDGLRREESVEADFAVVATGVKQRAGEPLESTPLVCSLRRMIPRFRPPRVRKTLICELQAEEGVLRRMSGELHFAQYGSRDCRIEMSSLIPKGRYITVALVGPEVDRAAPGTNLKVIERFLRLPYIKRLLPRSAVLIPACACNPSITVGAARRPFGDRVAVVGDLAVSRLYKDGVYSAYLTASALARAVLDHGIDAGSLEKAYGPAVRELKTDNWFGGLVFLLNRTTFARPVLSRILYQAVITERKTRPRHRRRLADVLWRIASGDDSYRSILGAMLHPVTIGLIGVGGVLVTARNYLIERIFGLKWEAFGRHPTAVAREDMEAKRREMASLARGEPRQRPPEFERMYSIKINAERAGIWEQLGRFGDEDREYFRPRFVRVRRTAGRANEAGSVVQYILPIRRLGFSMVLERADAEQLLVYRIRDGFPRGGILVFDIERTVQGA
ncbi:MAG: hypothetical protein HUU20_25075, partial [Pirellulales bacterium]|nr:hypothetical protein [Pirellulales bacterium]